MNKAGINIFLKIPSTWVAEMVAHKDFDFITIDMQHGLIDYQMAIKFVYLVHFNQCFQL